MNVKFGSLRGRSAARNAAPVSSGRFGEYRRAAPTRLDRRLMGRRTPAARAGRSRAPNLPADVPQHVASSPQPPPGCFLTFVRLRPLCRRSARCCRCQKPVVHPRADRRHECGRRRTLTQQTEVSNCLIADCFNSMCQQIAPSLPGRMWHSALVARESRALPNATLLASR